MKEYGHPGGMTPHSAFIIHHRRSNYNGRWCIRIPESDPRVMRVEAALGQL
jgi:hypothetical protein